MAGKKRNKQSSIGRRSTHGPMLGVTRKTPKKAPMPTNCPCDIGQGPGGSGTMVVYPTVFPGG